MYQSGSELDEDLTYLGASSSVSGSCPRLASNVASLYNSSSEYPR